MLILAGHERLLGALEAWLSFRGAGEGKALSLIGAPAAAATVSFALEQALALDEEARRRLRGPHLRRAVDEEPLPRAVPAQLAVGRRLRRRHARDRGAVVGGAEAAARRWRRRCAAAWRSGTRRSTSSRTSRTSTPTARASTRRTSSASAPTPEETLERWQHLKKRGERGDRRRARHHQPPARRGRRPRAVPRGREGRAGHGHPRGRAARASTPRG